jgi:hypothetical protein
VDQVVLILVLWWRGWRCIRSRANGTATAGGNGGDGVFSDITGSAVQRGGGGGGGIYAQAQVVMEVRVVVVQREPWS